MRIAYYHALAARRRGSRQYVRFALCVLSMELLVGCVESPAKAGRAFLEPIRTIGITQSAAPDFVIVSEDEYEPNESIEMEHAEELRVFTVPPTAFVPTDTPVPTPADTPVQMRASRRTASTETAEPQRVPAPTEGATGVEAFIAIAQSMMGKPYVPSGTTEDGFDPGGFLYYCLNGVGVKVPHKASRGYAEMERWPKIESLDDIKRGDLLFFRTGTYDYINCACIYLGNGKIIYPSSSMGVVITTKLNTDYWKEGFRFARRVF